ncbi:alpha/beta fold hydrolase [Phycicoccus sp. MQZ13P-5]|uniref:Alpha/beta fold hydrolase n=2 Tax=Phycicoccus sonneratiae TaxID=2807628 RepID=A0ABS2CNK0_9MICO|nr:alpha/beta fold hydrolase [Phycicoccus sonneraticus]
MWKAQVPHLARHHRVVTFDGRGSGESDRPEGAAAYANDEYAADTLAVMDAVGVGAAVLVGLSSGAAWAAQVAAARPDRVTGLVAFGPPGGSWSPQAHHEVGTFADPPQSTEGWSAYNRHHWLGGGYDDFVEFFFAQMYSEPHSTRQREESAEWAHEVGPRVLADATSGRLGLDGAALTDLAAVLDEVRCPVLVVHGTDDRVRAPADGEAFAQRTGGSLLLVEGAGHGVPARDPVLATREIDRFARQVARSGEPGRRWTRALSRSREVLVLSSPIGLGHARRDLAVVRALREQRPDVRVRWLAQDPVTRALERAGEEVHPASAWLASESAHVEAACGEHDLDAFDAIRRMDDLLVTNFLVLDEVLEREDVDLVVGDEAWETDHFLHENPERKRGAFAWLTDFVGWLPMPAGGEQQAALTADYNAEMLEHRARFPWVRDRSVFVGSPDDVVEGTFGPGLPGIRAWTEREFDFAGYVTGFTPPGEEERVRWRAELGFGAEETVCVVAVGGTSVGAGLLRRVLAAVPACRRARPDLRFVVVAGPRIEPSSLPATPGAEVLGWVPDLWRHLAACDVAVVQGGLTTCMELTASRTPFLFVPLRNHFEQNIHVRHRLERYRAGTHLPYEELLEPDAFAAALLATLAAPVTARPVETDGARRAASLLLDLL